MSILLLHRRSGIFYALEFASRELAKGIGMKKRLAKALNKRQSPLIHSFSTYNRYMGVSKQFVQYCKERGTNKIFKINETIVMNYFNERKIAYNLSEKTLKVNLCALEKFFKTIGRNDLAEVLRKRFSEIYSQGSAPGRTEYFGNPEQVINNLKDEAHRRIAELQYLTGGRIGDVKKTKTNMLLKQVIIPKSKGGKSRVLDYSDREEALQRIDKLCVELEVDIKQRGWQNLRKGYYTDLRQAVQRAGEIYSGAHAFRASYARERREELIDSDIVEKEADKIVSEELGHVRVSMGRYYSS